MQGVSAIKTIIIRTFEYPNIVISLSLAIQDGLG